MAILKNEYKSFLDDIEKNIKNKEDLEYIKERFSEFMDVVLEQMDNIMEYKSEEFEKLEQTQKQMSDKLEKMQQVIENIEKDIYADDGFDFEITCPYCNYEFIIDMDEDKSEIECPECHNTIELDWTGDLEEHFEGCSGHCHGCSSCSDEEKDENDEDEDM